MKYLQYDTYKDSGIEWLGEVPEHWDVRRLKNISSINISGVDKKSNEGEKEVRLCNYLDVYNNERLTNNINFMNATATENEIDNYTLQKMIL